MLTSALVAGSKAYVGTENIFKSFKQKHNVESGTSTNCLLQSTRQTPVQNSAEEMRVLSHRQKIMSHKALFIIILSCAGKIASRENALLTSLDPDWKHFFKTLLVRQITFVIISVYRYYNRFKSTTGYRRWQLPWISGLLGLSSENRVSSTTSEDVQPPRCCRFSLFL